MQILGWETGLIHEGVIFHGGCTVGSGIAYWLTYLENCIVRGARAKHRANALHRPARLYGTRIFTTRTLLTLIKYIISPSCGGDINRYFNAEFFCKFTTNFST